MLTGNDIAILLGFLAAAIALAGFAGIVTSIDRRVAGASSSVISYRVRNLVFAALSSVFLAIVPILLDTLEVVPVTRWQFACMIAAMASGGQVIAAFLGRMAMLAGDGDAGFSRPLFVVNMTLGVITILVAALGAAGFAAPRGAYYLTLAFLLYVTCTLFYRIVHMADEAARASRSG